MLAAPWSVSQGFDPFSGQYVIIYYSYYMFSRESEAQLMLQAMAHNEEKVDDNSNRDGYMFVPTGPGKGSGSGIYFADFSPDYKRYRFSNAQ